MPISTRTGTQTSLVHKLDVICKAGEEWQNMMRVTFDSLKNVCAEIAEKEQKNV